ncbi:hypothetical protein C7444_10387 [Sphaerotilus hippei]|uniref:Uncharacterized protein n=1 Tax=Sphaerotilus hippei TaxID=744406 RepID=A0A318H376_9BURK|nr:hypothetical protein [Sphaerotilus hippei]PXW97996.1 hypothetical protein C7444_10387 [Sphaerotilus hippei]
MTLKFLDRWSWKLLFIGIPLLGLGWVLGRYDAVLGTVSKVVGVLAVIVGVLMIVWRSRLPDDGQVHQSPRIGAGPSDRR